MSLLRHLAADLAHRWRAAPRSEKVRAMVFGVSVSAAALLAWQAATPAEPLGVSMRPLGGARAYAIEPPRGEEWVVPFDHEADGHAGLRFGGPGAKVTIESGSTTDATGAVSACCDRYHGRSEASSVRGGSSEDAVPLFRQNGARGESSMSGAFSGQ